MARKQKQLPIFYEVTITDVAAEGKAIAKVDDMVIFTQYAVPGDVVDLQIFKKKKNYMEGRVIKFHSYRKNAAMPCANTMALAVDANGKYYLTTNKSATNKNR